MKIYILPVSPPFQPESARIIHPAHNIDYGVEQDFLQYLHHHPQLIAENPGEADWHYLPIYWTRYHINNWFGKYGVPELQQEVNRVILSDYKTFTICQYDDGSLVNLGETTLFLSSRKTEVGIDIPLLCAPHPYPEVKPSKHYLGSFVGEINNHEMRRMMVERLKGRSDIYIQDGFNSIKLFVEKILESYIVLCPRGYGGSSFRFYEALQLGVPPLMISDIDTRPFKDFIKWDEISFFANISNLNNLLDSTTPSQLLSMGMEAIRIYHEELTYQKWCKYILMTLTQSKITFLPQKTTGDQMNQKDIHEQRDKFLRLIEKHNLKNILEKKEAIDTVFITQNLTYEEVWQELCTSSQCRPGAIIGGIGYNHPDFPGVKQAVDQFFGRWGGDISTEENIWWVEKKPIHVSFFIPAYNCENTLEESVYSIIEGNFELGDELIIVNDCSTDQTESVIKKLQTNFPFIQAFCHDTNKGGAATRNTAISHANNPILFCLDSDNILASGTIKNLKEFLINSGADIAAFQEIHFFVDKKENIVNKWVYQDQITLADVLSRHDVPGASGNYLFTKQSWQRAGGYPEFAGALDTHGFGLRQLATGSKMATMPNSYYYHRQGIESYLVRFSKTHNWSVTFAEILSPFSHLICELDWEYICGEGKYTWYTNLPQRPINLKVETENMQNLQVETQAVFIPYNLPENVVCTSQHLLPGESQVIVKFINNGDVVFDLGANLGDWTKEVITRQANLAELHIFEPLPHIFKSILEAANQNLNSIKIVPNNLAVGKEEDLKTFYQYDDYSTLSTLYRSSWMESQGWIQPPRECTVLCTTLDNYCKRQGIDHINFLKIDVEGAELDVLYGAINLIKNRNVHYIQFEYSTTYREANITLKQVCEYLQNHQYSIFKILPEGLEYRPVFLPDYEVFEWSNFLAVSSEKLSEVLGTRENLNLETEITATSEAQQHNPLEPETLVDESEINIIQRFISQNHIIFGVGANTKAWEKAVLKKTSDVKIHSFEPRLGLDTQVLSTTLDSSCQKQAIKRINFLKIDVTGGEFDVLQGAKDLLNRGKIDYIQFEYGQTYIDSGTTLQEVFEYLQKYRYSLFKILPERLEYISQFGAEYDNFQSTKFLAVNERFRAAVLGEPPRLLDVPQLCQQHSVVAKGIIHVGAHEGSEVEYYLAMGAQRVLFIEANPSVFERLQANIGKYPNVQAVNYAISHENGTVTLRVTSFDQSSSILPLKHHLDIYPTIQETEQVTVPSRTLDTLLQELGLNPADFNILNIDIQGAELLALQGATHWLQYVEAINTEVNYEELYEGCALIDDLDEFLDQYGLQRVATTTPHPFWGDAFYVKKPLVTMSILNRARFGNQIFLYAMLKIHQKEHDIQVETTSWIGQYLFGHNDPLISKNLPVALDSGLSILNAKEPIKNVEFGGPTYQVNTRYYAPYKDFFRSLFKPIPTIESKLKEALQRLQERGKTIVGLHLRRGDYREPYADFMFYAPNSCYRNWLRGLWETLESPVLFIASDDLESMREDFADYHPVTTKDLGIELPEASFYPDFYLLSHCDVLAISNSTFSFAAAMLNERCKFFFRPHLQSQKLIPFDPWDSEPLFWQGRGTWVESEGLDNKTGQNPVGTINISAVESLLPDTNLLWGSHVDLPSIGIQDNSDEIFVKGWVIGKESSVVAVELIYQGEVIHRTAVNQERMDITHAFPTFPSTKTAGYSTAVKLKKFLLGSTEVTIQAVFSDNNKVPIGLIQLEIISEVTETLEPQKQRLDQLEPDLTQVHQLQSQLESSQKSLSELYKERWKLKRLLARNQKPSVNSNNTSKLKWFFAINSESPGFDSYSQMLKVAVQTAQRNTSLEPFCIYDGSENDVTQWLRENGVTVIHHRSPHYEQFKREFPSCYTVAAGAFLRVEIPKIVEMYGMPDEYVLYTDCDVIFQNDFVDRLKRLTCKYIAAAPEHEADNWSYLNSGVLYMNIKNLLKIHEEFNDFIKNNLDEIMKYAYDQGAYNFFFKERWERLDIGLNWKSYWPLNHKAFIIHFHGPKPNQTHEILNGTASALTMLFVNDSYWQNSDVWQDHYEELKHQEVVGFMGSFLKEGDLVFDVGANLGQTTDLYLACGANIICFEPQPYCVESLHQKYKENPHVIIQNKGLADQVGEMKLSICNQTHVLSTFSDQWKTGRFSGFSWEQRIPVEVTTLDAMIEQWGCPKLCQIDVEGFEYQVLKGLSRPIPYLSFEFTQEFLDEAKNCVKYLELLGYQQFNWTQGAVQKFVCSEWNSADSVLAAIQSSTEESLWGFIYARWETSSVIELEDAQVSSNVNSADSAQLKNQLEYQQQELQQLQQELAKAKSELHNTREELERSQSQFDEVLAELEETHLQLHQYKQSKTDESISVQ